MRFPAPLLSLSPFLLATALAAASVSAQPREPAPSAPADSARDSLPPAYPVLHDGDTVFVIHAGTGSFSAAERAAVITRRLADLADSIESSGAMEFVPDSLRVRSFEGVREVAYGEIVIARVTPADAGGNADSVAAAWRAAVLADLDGSRADANLLRLVLRGAGAAGIILLIVLVELLMFRLARRAKEALTRFAAQGRLPVLRIQRVTLLTPQRSQDILLTLFRGLVTAAHGVIAFAAILLLFSVFPWTRELAGILFTWSMRPFRAAFLGFVDFLPDLFHIVIVLVLAHLFLRLLARLAREVQAGNLRFPGFYPDWARPTLNIVRFITYAFALVLIFPRLPGSDSVAFRGVSVFLGILVSLGSSAAFSNIIAGIVMTYMRSFRDGDRIQVGDVIGDVKEKTLLVTRIKTFHGETVTLPNSALLAGNTINYTEASRGRGLLLHTQVTIGYDVPWRTVHGLLEAAAARTTGVLSDPPPFVLQTALNDFYVSYELNVYTRIPERMNYVYSDLHQNIQDSFFAAGVEIMSPHYRSMRDGNAPAIPENPPPVPPPDKEKTGEGTP